MTSLSYPLCDMSDYAKVIRSVNHSDYMRHHKTVFFSCGFSIKNIVRITTHFIFAISLLLFLFANETLIR